MVPEPAAHDGDAAIVETRLNLGVREPVVAQVRLTAILTSPERYDAPVIPATTDPVFRLILSTNDTSVARVVGK